MAIKEGQTATNPQTGERVVFQGGAWVPTAGASSAPVRGGPQAEGKYYEKFAQNVATQDANAFPEISQIRANAGDILTTSGEANALLTSKDNLTGPLFDAAKGFARLVPWGIGQDKERLANMTAFEQISKEGVLSNVKKLPGPLSEKELAFLSRTTFDPNALPEENMEIARRRAAAATKMNTWADAKEDWINRYGTPRAKDEQGRSFDQVWGQRAQQDFTPIEYLPPQEKATRYNRQAAQSRTTATNARNQALSDWRAAWGRTRGNLDGADQAFDAWWSKQMAARGRKSGPPTKPKASSGGRLKYNPNTGDFE